MGGGSLEARRGDVWGVWKCMMHLSLPRPFTPDLKLSCFTNSFLYKVYSLFGFISTAFTDLGVGPDVVCRSVLFVLVSSFLFLVTCAG